MSGRATAIERRSREMRGRSRTGTKSGSFSSHSLWLKANEAAFLRACDGLIDQEKNAFIIMSAYGRNERNKGQTRGKFVTYGRVAGSFLRCPGDASKTSIHFRFART
jgi:hypothetical protein